MLVTTYYIVDDDLKTMNTCQNDTYIIVGFLAAIEAKHMQLSTGQTNRIMEIQTFKSYYIV